MKSLYGSNPMRPMILRTEKVIRTGDNLRKEDSSERDEGLKGSNPRTAIDSQNEEIIQRRRQIFRQDGVSRTR